MDTPVQIQPVQAGVNKGAEMLEGMLAAKGLAVGDGGQMTQAQQLQPQPQPQPQPVDYASRFAAPQQTDPLANLEGLPDLPPDQPVPQPQNMGEQQNHAWAALRAQANQNRRNAEQYLKRYNDLVEKTKSFQAERTEFGSKLNEKDKEIESLRNEIGRLDLSRSPEFKEKYEAPIYAVHDDMVRTLVDNGVEEADAKERIGQILGVQNPNDVAQLVGDLPTHVQGMLMIKSQDAFRMMDARQHALDDWKTSQDGLAAVANRGSAMIEAQRRDKLAKAALDLIRSMPDASKIPAYQVVDPQFVADREKHEGEFMKWVQQAPAEQMYAAMLEGFMAPKTYEMLNQYAQENAELKAALYNRGRAAAPVVSAGAGYVPPPPPVKPDQGQPQPVPVQADPAQSLVRGIFERNGMLPPGM